MWGGLPYSKSLCYGLKRWLGQRVPGLAKMNETNCVMHACAGERACERACECACVRACERACVRVCACVYVGLGHIMCACVFVG